MVGGQQKAYFSTQNVYVKVGMGSKCAQSIFMYSKVASSNTSHLEAHAGFFRLLMKGIFDPYVL